MVSIARIRPPLPVGSRYRPVTDPAEAQRILEDRAHFVPTFADAFTSEDDALRERQLDWQRRADPAMTGTFAPEWAATRASARTYLESISGALATRVAAGVHERIAREPRATDREIVAPAVSVAASEALGRPLDPHIGAFVLGLTPAAEVGDELAADSALCALARAAAPRLSAVDGAFSADVIQLVGRALADTVALLLNALPQLATVDVAILDEPAARRLARSLEVRERPRRGAMRLVRSPVEIDSLARAVGDEVWIDLAEANRGREPGASVIDHWDPLVSQSIELARRTLEECCSLMARTATNVAQVAPGREVGTFFWHELRGGTIARR